MRKFLDPTLLKLEHFHSKDWMRLGFLAFSAAAGVAILASIAASAAENRLHRKLSKLADSIQSALPTLQHAAALYTCTHTECDCENQPSKKI